MMAKAKQKYYAIRVGKDPKTKEPVLGRIFLSWDEAFPYVNKVEGAEYKSFTTEEDANDYLQGGSGTVSVNVDMKPDILYCYVDGSFNGEIQNYSFGLCVVFNDKVVHIDRGQGANKEAVKSQQIAGELLGAMTALKFAKGKYKEVVILHDYQGVAGHATGDWKRENPVSETYYNWMRKFFIDNQDMKVTFQRVPAHQGNDFNEIVDGLAKMALHIKPNPIFYRMIEKHGVIVD